jgi:PPOX class probable F420-dependent enzyme
MKTPQSVRELLPKAPLAHLTTLNSDGSPQVTVVWVGIEDEGFVIGHMAVHQKVKNIRRDPRVALSMLGDRRRDGNARMGAATPSAWQPRQHAQGRVVR